MSRYIEADALINNIPSEEIIAKMAVAHAPTIEIVRCKECRWLYDLLDAKDKTTHYYICKGHNYFTKLDDFCSYGERTDQ